MLCTSQGLAKTVSVWDWAIALNMHIFWLRNGGILLGLNWSRAEFFRSQEFLRVEAKFPRNFGALIDFRNS